MENHPNSDRLLPELISREIPYDDKKMYRRVLFALLADAAFTYTGIGLMVRDIIMNQSKRRQLDIDKQTSVQAEQEPEVPDTRIIEK